MIGPVLVPADGHRILPELESNTPFLCNQCNCGQQFHQVIVNLHGTGNNGPI